MKRLDWWHKQHMRVWDETEAPRLTCRTVKAMRFTAVSTAANNSTMSPAGQRPHRAASDATHAVNGCSSLIISHIS